MAIKTQPISTPKEGKQELIHNRKEEKSSFDNATWDVSKALVGQDYNQIKMTNWRKVIFEYVCPTLGIFISTALYSAPVKVSGIVRSCCYEKKIHLISSAIA